MGKTYRYPSQKPALPKRSRTLPIFGTGDDAGKYYHCWNCGFVCNSQRDELGDSNSEAGDNHTDYNGLVGEAPVHNYGGKLVDVGKQACLGGDIGHHHVSMELGCDFTHELVQNSDFNNWNSDYPAKWIQYGTPDSSNYVVRSGNNLRVVRDDSVSGVWQNVLSSDDIDKSMTVAITIDTVTSGTITVEQGAGNYISSQAGISSTGTSTYTHIPQSTSAYIIGATNTTDIIVSKFSVKRTYLSTSRVTRLPRTIRHDIKPNVTHGCPFCGSTNWRGDY